MLMPPSILSPHHFSKDASPQTQAKLRRFAQTAVVRRAINVIRDRIAGMDLQTRVRAACGPTMWPSTRASCAHGANAGRA